MASWGAVSESRLRELHPDLQKLCNEVIKHIDCFIVCAYRGQEEQDRAFAEGKSKLKFPHGNHNQYPSRAVDLIPYPVDWDDNNQMRVFAGFVLGVAAILGIGIRWGGDWDRDWDVKDNKFNDFPHFELTNGD